ncbi:hypothetical protein [Inmirania thermothiophila]|uniref:Uncharacterized protein n=1 Tax=Inmirania thermothiophila TaxID=1750597 RepID=A0A3N1Y0J8_9GAMM|nr:hypothetical protein [Inmirania thermothiophila]ROR32359.1 hypothetical protein EDC57_1557 [Inmirania thermothiophila]
MSSNDIRTTDLRRRRALARLGLGVAAAYVTPTLLTLSDARASGASSGGEKSEWVSTGNKKRTGGEDGGASSAGSGARHEAASGGSSGGSGAEGEAAGGASRG